MTETLQLPFGYAVTEYAQPVSASDWSTGMSHRRARGPATPRRWQARWDGVALGARMYLEQLLAAAQGDVLNWTPPNNDDAAVKVRMRRLSCTMASPQNHTITAELEEAVEPC